MACCVKIYRIIKEEIIYYLNKIDDYAYWLINKDNEYNLIDIDNKMEEGLMFNVNFNNNDNNQTRFDNLTLDTSYDII